MKKQLFGCVLICCNMVSYADEQPPNLFKPANALCGGAVGPNFVDGDGSTLNPFLICNKEQMNRLSVEPDLLTNHFKLGNNLNYFGESFFVIGSNNAPFEGSFNGDNYTISNLNIVDRDARGNYLGIFGYTQNADVSNLIVNGLGFSSGGFYYTGGLIGEAHDTKIHNVKISNINVKAVNYAGGFIGSAFDTVITNSGVQGIVNITYGSDAAGGFIGSAERVDISMSYSKIRLRQIDSIDSGVSIVGVFGGQIYSSNVSDCYALGDIDFSAVTKPGQPRGPQGVAGFVSSVSGTTVNNVFYAGKFINLNHVVGLGGAVSYADTSTVNNLFWDMTLTNYMTSALGTGQTTTTMKTSSFWLNAGFSPSKWSIRRNVYPKLIWE